MPEVTPQKLEPAGMPEPEEHAGRPGAAAWLITAASLLIALLSIGRGITMLAQADWSDGMEDADLDSLQGAIFMFVIGAIALMPVILLALRRRADHGFWWLSGMSGAMLAIILLVFWS